MLFRSIRFRELGVAEFAEDHKAYIAQQLDLLDNAEEKNRNLEEIKGAVYESIARMDSRTKGLVKPYLTAMDAIRLFNELGRVVASRAYGKNYGSLPDAWKLAEELENWLYHYKEIYRSVSRESELSRIQEIIIWYADYLRGKENLG